MSIKKISNTFSDLKNYFKIFSSSQTHVDLDYYTITFRKYYSIIIAKVSKT